MPLWDDPEHRISLFSVATSRDGGGGVEYSYSLAQSGVPCLNNTASASESLLFAQQGIVVTHTISIASSELTSPVARGWKVVDENGSSYHVEGIRAGRAVDELDIPAFTYLQCREQL